MRALIYSMTGFGSSTGRFGDRMFQIELRSVNHRFLDIKTRLPRELAPLEAKLRTTLQADLHRGALECRFEWTRSEHTKEADEWIRLQEAERAIQTLLHLGSLIPKSEPQIRISDVLALPGIVVPRSRDDELSASRGVPSWEDIEPALKEAISQFKGSRSSEGAELRVALLEKIRMLQEGVSKLSELRTQSLASSASRLVERMERIFEAYPLRDAGQFSTVLESRISQEVALLTDRLDVDEELTRLNVHLSRFSTLLKEGGLLGKKLEFLLQEINRELTTLGNKAQDVAMSEILIELKTAAEQIREQVMNIE